MATSPGVDARSVDDLLPRDDPDREPREVVLARPRTSPGARPSRRRGARSPTPCTPSRCPRTTALGDADVELPGPEIVEEEERARAAGDDVVHAHADEVEADRVVRRRWRTRS